MDGRDEVSDIAVKGTGEAAGLVELELEFEGAAMVEMG